MSPSADLVGASDEQLVAAYVAGNAAAFDQLVSRYSRRVYGICLHYFGNASDAEDAAQEAFVALLRRASTYAGASAFSTWMFRVTTNACNDLARKRARRPRSAATPVEELAEVSSPDDLIANRELGMELEQALASLDPEQRTAVVLHDVGGVPYADIAARTGVPVGTVKSRVSRGHARLAAVLADRRPLAPAPVSADPVGEPSPPTAPPT